ncbi:MAG: deoxyguanosinetriphosphate triphosphohydrolase family protein [Thermodesulfobacteriota bacterium]
MGRYDLHPPFAGLQQILEEREAKTLSEFATPSAAGLRRQAEDRLAVDYRQHFAVDVDRILHSLAYSRYIDKTQVFYLIQNDHITHRMIHVQLVSKVARTIGRFLGLNEDLIEAIAIGHDIGHPPFGHDGERFLSALCQRHGIGAFHHNVQSIQFLRHVEKKGRGWNLCLQTLDGILCHDGEVHNRVLEPVPAKGFADHEAEMAAKRSGKDPALVPASLEGCVVRFADSISYVGRDIEDAIRLNLIQRSDLPRDCVEVLGDTNGTIVYTLVTDVIQNSYGTGHVSFSSPVSQALEQLKRFNYGHIYTNPAIKQDIGTIEKMFGYLFDRYLTDIHEQNPASPVYENFINGMSSAYRQSHAPAQIVRDFIAGMTDQYFLHQVPAAMRPPIRTGPAPAA